jgi:hypothetical protein
MRSGTKNNLVYYILPLKQIKIPILREKVGNVQQTPSLRAYLAFHMVDLHLID